jgi:type I site-specific restriction-modification system R (restriction) subunit
MAYQDKTPAHIKIDERNHVEKPLLDQLDELGWEIIDLDMQQQPQQSFRENFSDVVLGPVLREQLKVINPWLEDDQVEEVAKRLTASFPGNNLLENNCHVLNLLLENTSVAENRKTGEKSPTVRYIDFTHLINNRFIAICQFKVRILGTEYHIVPDIVLFMNGLPVVLIECKSAQGQGTDSGSHRPDAALQRTARRQGRRQRAVVLLQSIYRGDLLQRSQVRHHHHPPREALLPLVRPLPAHGRRLEPQWQQPQRSATAGGRDVG